jgi:hypothetical protein
MLTQSILERGYQTGREEAQRVRSRPAQLLAKCWLRRLIVSHPCIFRVRITERVHR